MRLHISGLIIPRPLGASMPIQDTTTCNEKLSPGTVAQGAARIMDTVPPPPVSLCMNILTIGLPISTRMEEAPWPPSVWGQLLEESSEVLWPLLSSSVSSTGARKTSQRTPVNAKNPKTKKEPKSSSSKTPMSPHTESSNHFTPQHEQPTNYVHSKYPTKLRPASPPTRIRSTSLWKSRPSTNNY